MTPHAEQRRRNAGGESGIPQRNQNGPVSISQLADELGDNETKMYLLTTLGDARQQDGESDTAVQAFQQALEIARREAGVAPERFRMLSPGEVWDL